MAELTPEQKAVLEQLLKDYKAAAEAHVPGYTGGISHKIAVALVQMGWRKSNPN